jgi:hypothetical protein
MSGMMEAVRTSETSVNNYFTLQYIPEDNSEHSSVFFLSNQAAKKELRAESWAPQTTSFALSNHS